MSNKSENVRVLGWAPKVKITEEIAETIDYCPSFGYTDKEKLVRIQSILSVNPPDALKLIKSVMDN